MQTQQQWLGGVRWIGQSPWEQVAEEKTPELETKPWPQPGLNPTAARAAQTALEQEKQANVTEHAVQRALSPTEKILLASVIISAIGLLYSIFGRRR